MLLLERIGGARGNACQFALIVAEPVALQRRGDRARFPESFGHIRKTARREIVGAQPNGRLIGAAECLDAVDEFEGGVAFGAGVAGLGEAEVGGGGELVVASDVDAGVVGVGGVGASLCVAQSPIGSADQAATYSARSPTPPSR